MITRVRQILKNQKGSAIFQFIIILAIVAILAVATLPSLNNKIEEKATRAINRIDTMDDSIENNN